MRDYIRNPFPESRISTNLCFSWLVSWYRNLGGQWNRWDSMCKNIYFRIRRYCWERTGMRTDGGYFVVAIIRGSWRTWATQVKVRGNDRDSFHSISFIASPEGQSCEMYFPQKMPFHSNLAASVITTLEAEAQWWSKEFVVPPELEAVSVSVISVGQSRS